MATVKNCVGDELEITIDSDGDICIEDICGDSSSYNRREALQMAAILNHYALTGELRLPNNRSVVMDITKSREEFEIEFATKRGLRIEQVISARYGDGYWDEARIVTAGIGIAWDFWKAGRESIEIDLNHLGYIQVEEDVFYPDIEAIRRLLVSSGIRIKGESE